MKYLTIILLFISVNCFSQYNYDIESNYFESYTIVKEQKSQAWKVITIYTGAIVLNAVGDGLNDSDNKQWGHLCNATSIGLLLASPFVIDYDKDKWFWYLTSYVSLRIALFDYTYNLTRGLPIDYIGGTSTWDKVLKYSNPPNTYMGRGVFFTIGITIPINKL